MKSDYIMMRVPLQLKDFLNKLAINRIKVGSDDNLKPSYSYLIKLMIDFFKSDNEVYKKLVSMEVKHV